ncbi:MAG TPA: alpha/beta hydrolase [Flavisolibacter sp.]|jgi:dipeptidyl aminopeptidase/acylaminoacyl peptidase|nr:alpha/beta hydrolase [Flavisolibacter sp.]
MKSRICIAPFLGCLFFLLSTAAAQAQVTPERISYAQKDTHSLWMDHYRPQVQANGMSVLFVHGGAFTGGDPRNQSPMGEGLAKMGYHVFVIRYRLYLKGKDFGCGTPTPEKLKAIQWGVEDALDATQHLLKHAASLGIDSAKIFIAGSSAGAEAILNLVFNPFRKKSDQRYALFDRFQYAGALSFAGAVLDINTVNKNSWIPLLLMHGTKDQLVPFGTAAHRFCRATDPGLMMFFGSHTIYEKAKKEKLPLRLYTFPGGGHEVSNYMFRRFREMDDFMKAAVNGKLKGAKEIIVKADKK